MNRSSVETKKFASRGLNFFERIQVNKTKHEKNLETIRMKNSDPSVLEYTFKPQVSDFAKGMKRNMDDLFVIYY